MKYLYITACIVGQTWMYERINQKGRKKLVATYLVEMGDDANPNAKKTYAAVTRDSALVVFGHRKKRYLKNGECPPNCSSKAYRGRLYTAPRNGLSMLVWENGFSNRHTLKGVGQMERYSVQIHHGPASGLGCMTIAGGALGYQKWITAAKILLPNPDDELMIFIDPRPESHHAKHLTH